MPEYTIITDEGDVKRTSIRSEEEMVQMLQSGFVMAILRLNNEEIEYCDIEAISFKEDKYRIIWGKPDYICPECGAMAKNEFTTIEHDDNCTMKEVSKLGCKR